MKVFLSYPHISNELDRSVTRFHTRLLNELKLRKPQAAIFFDEDNIQLGDDFPDKLRSSLEQADVFMPIISPAWLASKWCRKEYKVYIESRNGRVDLVAPIMWVKTDEFSESSQDELARKISRKQYWDWRDIRLLKDEDPQVRESASELAETLDTFLDFKSNPGPSQGISISDTTHVLTDLEHRISDITNETMEVTPNVRVVVRSVWDAVDKTSQHLNQLKRQGSIQYEPNQELFELWNTAALNLSTHDRNMAYILRAKATFWSDPASWDPEEFEDFDISITNLRKVALNLIDLIGT